MAFYLQSGTMTINGGTITGSTGVYAKGGSLSVPSTSTAVITGNGANAGWSFNGNGANSTGDALVIDNSAYPYGPATATIAGGTYESTNGDAIGNYTKNAETLPTATGFVSGGTFSNAVAEEFCAEGFEPKDNGDGTYGVRVDKGWIYEDADFPGYTGSWNKEISYDETTHKAAIEDGATYTASKPSAGQLVTVAMTLSFDDVNDEDETVGDAKAAVKLATGGFKVYTSEGPDGAVTSVWKSVTIEGSDMIPVADQDYKFLFVLDLTNTTYTAALITSGGAATNALVLTDGSVANIPFASRGNVAPVQQIEFIGSGSVTSIEGSYEDVPVPEGFVEDEVVTLSDGTATLTAAQATWLNACGAKAAVAAKIATMDSTAFNNAYLLNLDITGEFSYEFKVTNINVGDTTVTMTVSLTRTGALDETTKINGTVALTGTDELGKTFETISEATVADDDFSESNTTTISLDKSDAKFYLPVIE